MAAAGFFRVEVRCYGRGDFGALGRAAYVSGGQLEQVDPVALAAYRAGAQLDNRTTGKVADFRRRSGVVASWSTAPKGAPAWTKDTSVCWSLVDAAETRKNSRVARDIMVSWPHQMSAKGRQHVSQAMGEWLAERFHTVVQCAIHEPQKSTADDRNFHSHFLMGTRELAADGRGFSKKIRELDDRKTGPKAVAEIRAKAADIINLQLERELLGLTVEHKSARKLATEVRAKQHREDARQLDNIKLPNAREQRIRLQAEHAWREEDRARRLAQPPIVWDHDTQILAAEKEQHEVKARTDAKVSALEEKLGRKASRREVGGIRRQVRAQRAAAIKRRHPTKVIAYAELNQLRFKKGVDDLRAKQRREDRIAELADQIRDRKDPLQVKIAAIAEKFRQAPERDRGLGR